MRSLINKIPALLGLAMMLLLIHPAKTHAQSPYDASYQTFYDELAPYGTWVEDPDYGDVWVPNVDEGFMPYSTSGHWVLTDYGNTWVSDYPWGWATFHYGRWKFDDYYGWEWIPGRHWGPAWVNWRTGGGYYAWAPLGPGVSLNVSLGDDYYIPEDYWVCAPQAYICSPFIYNYYVPRERVVNVIHQTVIISNTYVNNNVTYISGPRPAEIREYSRTPVQVYHINNNPSRTPVINNTTINIYRPAIAAPPAGGNTPRPATVVNAVAYRQANPNAGIANHGNTFGATTNHSNAAMLAQTARNPQQQSNVVKVYRPSAVSSPAPTAPQVQPQQQQVQPSAPQNQPAQQQQWQRHQRPVPVQPAQQQPQPAVQTPAPQTQQPAQQQAAQQRAQQAQQQQAAQQQAAQQARQQAAQQQAAQQRAQQQPAQQQQQRPQPQQQQQQRPQPQQQQQRRQPPPQKQDPRDQHPPQ